MADIQAILFDFGGTLDSDGTHWFVRMHRILGAMGVTIDYALFDHYADVAAHDLAKRPDTRKYGMEEMVAALLTHVRDQMHAAGCNGSCAWQVKKVTEFFTAESHRFIERNRSLLRELQGSYRLGCISNNWGNTAGWCAQCRLTSFFETIIDSTVVGFSKPKAEIFAAALKDLALTAAQCVYVGDHFECDVVGAKGVGMTTVWVNDGSKPCPDAGLVDHRIGSLTELAALPL